jgi:hypothetical protein
MIRSSRRCTRRFRCATASSTCAMRARRRVSTSASTTPRPFPWGAPSARACVCSATWARSILRSRGTAPTCSCTARPFPTGRCTTRSKRCSWAIAAGVVCSARAPCSPSARAAAISRTPTTRASRRGTARSRPCTTARCSAISRVDSAPSCASRVSARSSREIGCASVSRHCRSKR